MDDRTWLTKEYLPKLGGRILYVGTNDYTQPYSKLVQSDSVYETLDSSVERSKFGGDIHHNVDVLDHNPNYLYDHVSMHGCHGYTGYNIDNGHIKKDMEKLSSLVKVGGTLQFGPGCGYDPNYTRGFWENFVTESPFNEYDVLHNTLNGVNYIWWGVKK